MPAGMDGRAMMLASREDKRGFRSLRPAALRQLLEDASENQLVSV
jgi:hypothetical protein